MRNPLRLVVVGALCLVATPAAWAAAKPPAKPVKGASYEGATASKKSTIKLKVARSGKSVTVWLGVLPTGCAASGQGPIQKTAAARISSRGAFKGTISYEGLFTSGVTAKAYFSGQLQRAQSDGHGAGGIPEGLGLRLDDELRGSAAGAAEAASSARA